MSKQCFYLHGVDFQRLLETVDALLELLAAEVQQGFGAHGSGASTARQLPRPVVVLMIVQDVPE